MDGASDQLAFTPVTITCIDLCYFVPNPNKDATQDLQLLRGVTATLQPGMFPFPGYHLQLLPPYCKGEYLRYGSGGDGVCLACIPYKTTVLWYDALHSV